MRLITSALSVLLAGGLSACLAGSDDNLNSKEQLLRGHVPLSSYAADVVGVRVVSNGRTVATAQTDTAGYFQVRVPEGKNYAFEIVTKSGSHTLLTGPIQGEAPLSFDICDPGEDFDLGEIDPFDFEEIDGDDVPWSDTDDDCSVPPWLCGEGGDPNDCIEEPLPCDTPDSDPTFCWVEPLPCDDANADPDFCFEEPIFCDAPDADPNECIEEPPFPCDDPNAGPDGCLVEPPFCEDPNVDPESCGGELPPPLPCDEENGDCGFEECENGYEDPTCWPEVDICILDPNGELDCDEDIGAAPEFPFPDFGCEEVPGGDEDIGPPLPEAPEPA